jgi:uncharacterized protein YjiK
VTGAGVGAFLLKFSRQPACSRGGFLLIISPKKMKKIVTALLSIVLSAFLLQEVTGSLQPDKDGYSPAGNPGGSEKDTGAVSPDVKVVSRWDVPDILREVSGIAYLGPNRFACVQDEQGTIFIYNTDAGKIEKEIDFAGPGDYEGIALVGQTAYVVRSDGRLYEINDLESSAPAISVHPAPFAETKNIEGICYDPKNNRLLLSVKEESDYSKAYKGIYAFDLLTKKMDETAVYKIDFNHSIFGGGSQNEDVLLPSEVQLHPVTGNIYLTDAKNTQLLVLCPDGTFKTRYKISESEFYKPEGIAFSPTGELFISNEGKIEKGNILQVNIAGL